MSRISQDEFFKWIFWGYVCMEEVISNLKGSLKRDGDWRKSNLVGGWSGEAIPSLDAFGWSLS